MGKNLKVIITTGLAMFSMFFGAANVILPLDVGRVAGNMNFYAILGVLLAAVVVPFLGLVAMFLFEGDYRTFFERIGVIPGKIIIAVLLAILGPFVVIPRGISLACSTLQVFFPNLSLFYFSFFLCVILYVITVERRKVLHFLGYILGPLLLISLFALIIYGFINHPAQLVKNYSKLEIFLHGIKEGYFTLDLIGAFFFSVVVMLGLKRELGHDVNIAVTKGRKEFFTITLLSSLIGSILLCVVYICVSYVASFNGSILATAEKDTILTVLAFGLAGVVGGIVANVIIFLTALHTTTLAVIFAEYLQNELFKNILNYRSCLLITLIIAFAMSNLGFMGILKMSTPFLLVCYPVLIVLTLLNISKELFGFKPVKIPVLITFVISLLVYLFA
jgi:branched-chain amino acid:cation transporter, LIVCS family